MALSKLSKYFSGANLTSFKCHSSTTPKKIAPLQEAALAERCILVDAKDTQIGAASKLDCHRVQTDGSLLLHRAFSVFLFNERGDMLLQKRSANKVTFPSHISNACCSHPLADYASELKEDDAMGVRCAAKRRLSYELGIPEHEISINDFNYITRIHYQATDDGIWGENEIDYVLFLQKNVTINPNLDEVSKVEYISQHNLQNYMMTSHDPFTPWFRLIAQRSLPIWWANLPNIGMYKNHAIIQK